MQNNSSASVYKYNQGRQSAGQYYSSPSRGRVNISDPTEQIKQINLNSKSIKKNVKNQTNKKIAQDLSSMIKDGSKSSKKQVSRKGAKVQELKDLEKVRSEKVYTQLSNVVLDKNYNSVKKYIQTTLPFIQITDGDDEQICTKSPSKNCKAPQIHLQRFMSSAQSNKLQTTPSQINSSLFKNINSAMLMSYEKVEQQNQQSSNSSNQLQSFQQFEFLNSEDCGCGCDDLFIHQLNGTISRLDDVGQNFKISDFADSLQNQVKSPKKQRHHQKTQSFSNDAIKNILLQAKTKYIEATNINLNLQKALNDVVAQNKQIKDLVQTFQQICKSQSLENQKLSVRTLKQEKAVEKLINLIFQHDCNIIRRIIEQSQDQEVRSDLSERDLTIDQMLFDQSASKTSAKKRDLKHRYKALDIKRSISNLAKNQVVIETLERIKLKGLRYEPEQDNIQITEGKNTKKKRQRVSSRSKNIKKKKRWSEIDLNLPYFTFIQWKRLVQTFTQYDNLTRTLRQNHRAFPILKTKV